VHAVLAPLRAVADEIVVAANSTSTPEALAWYGAVADRLFTYEYRLPARAYGWLQAQCSGDWTLLIDGDECVSAGLLERIPELIARRSVNQYFIPRRWLFPDPGHWLDEWPWWPDFANRLTRNDGGLFVQATLHGGTLRVDPAAFLDDPLYHLAALQPLESRRAKVGRYLEHSTDLTVRGDLPLNETFYLPETSARLPLALVPAVDRVLVRALVEGTPGAAPPPPREVCAVPLAKTDRYWAGREFSPDGYRCRIEQFERGLLYAPGDVSAAFVRLTNEGTETWPWGLERAPHIHVSYEWLVDGQWSPSEVITPLPHTFEPGKSALVPVTIAAPMEPGRRRLRVDLRHAGHRWVGCPLELELEVRASGPKPEPGRPPRRRPWPG
jgi:hypothetical protein